MELIHRYFPDLTEDQMHKLSRLKELYDEWNAKINVISRKDMDQFYCNHVLHSLSIAKIHSFKVNENVLDIGTGGGFPGIPLAILFPETHFHLVDSIGKKIKVVNEVAEGLGLQNISTTHGRVEEDQDTYDFIVSRAVAQMETFVRWTKGKINKKQEHKIKNGILYLKGGDLTEELKKYTTVSIFNLSDFFDEDFFDTKKVVHLPMKYKG